MNQLAYPRGRFPGGAIGQVRRTDTQWPLMRLLLVLTVVATPLFVPRLPGNSIPVDIVNVCLIAFGSLLLTHTGAQTRIPLVVPTFMIVIGGLIATTQSVAVDRSLLAIAQDVYLFGVFLVIVNLVGQDPTERTAGALAAAWASAGVAMGALVWGVKAAGAGHLFGVRMVDPFGRSHGPLRDPNMAGVYLVMSLFVLWLSPWPKRPSMKFVASVPIVLGVHATGSNTALFTLTAGVVATLGIGFIAHRESRATRTAALLALVGITVLFTVIVPPDAASRLDRSLDALGETPIFSASLGRIDSSLEPRAERWRDSLELFRSELVVGIGPSATNEWLETIHARVGGEIHNDFVAGFLERGILGGIGNLLLFAGLLLASGRLALNNRLRETGWIPSAAVGAAVTVLLAANALETLHFRHVWLLFALIVGIQLRLRGTPAP